MSSILQYVCFILESVEISDLFQRFSIFLRLDDYEWLTVGNFVKSDLPFGINFPILIDEKWFEKPEIEILLKFGKTGKDYEGILDIAKDDQGKLTASGTATLFEISDTNRGRKNEIAIDCTILVEDIKQRESILHQETQTMQAKNKNADVQTDPVVEQVILTNSVATSTDGNFVKMEHFRQILEEKLAQKILEIQSSHRVEDENRKVHNSTEIEDPKPSDSAVNFADQQTNEDMMHSHNLVPRMTKLKQLDQMILERTKLLEKMDLEIEMKKKVAIIIEKRKDLKVQEGEKKNLEKEKAKSPEVSNQESSKASSSESSEDSGDSDDSDDSEDSDSSADKNESDEEKDDSESSEEIKEVTKVPKDEKSEEKAESEIEDPFSPKATEPPPPATPPPAVLSPTSQYLENLRQKILDQYNSKITGISHSNN